MLLSLGLFSEPNIFVSTKYFFLWPFQVYYHIREEYFHAFLSNSAGNHLSLLEDPVVTFLHENSFPVGGCWPVGPFCSQQQPWLLSHPGAPSQADNGARSKPSSLLKRAKQLPKAASHREFTRVAAAQKLSGKGLWPKGAAHMGSTDPPLHWSQWAAQNLTPTSLSSSTTCPRDSSPCHLFLSLSYEFDFRCLRTAFWALVFPPDFPCHALLHFIFKPDHCFLFSLCFNTQALDNQTSDWLCATSVLSQAKFHSICGTTCHRERDSARHLPFHHFLGK